jgi:DCN1-like protein 3
MKASGELKALKRDEWNHMLDFLQAHPNSLKDYSDQEAWPVLYDKFVTWAKEQKPELF